MIARHTGYKPGIFTHFVANEQIYDRHDAAATEMLDRFDDLQRDEFYGKVIKKPYLTLNPNKTNFYDFTIDDFTMEDYEPIKPQLKLELGI
jgi:thymidylate synthase